MLSESLEALWSVIFMVNGVSVMPRGGAGIVVIDNGRILGGDTAYTYVGSVLVENDVATARVHVQKYQSIPGISSVTGLDDYFLILQGTPSSPQMVLNGHVEGQPIVKMSVSMTRRAEIE